jgi:NAD+ synthase
MAVGHAALPGDLCGGFSPLKDLYRTQVVALARWRNAHCPTGALGPKGPVMPERIIARPPRAELPPHAVLDAILECLIEGGRSVDDLVAAGHDRATVLHVWRMLDQAEYKRRQAPPGVTIGPRAFGRDRRYPITNGYTKLIT